MKKRGWINKLLSWLIDDCFHEWEYYVELEFKEYVPRRKCIYCEQIQELIK